MESQQIPSVSCHKGCEWHEDAQGIGGVYSRVIPGLVWGLNLPLFLRSQLLNCDCVGASEGFRVGVMVWCP